MLKFTGRIGATTVGRSRVVMTPGGCTCCATCSCCSSCTCAW